MNKTPPSPPVTPRFERDPAFLDTYANQLRMSVTTADFALIFGVNDDLAPGNVVVRDKVAVHLPPGVAKALLVQLQMAVEAYEEAIAPIPVPAAMASQIEMAKQQILAALTQQMRPQRTEPTPKLRSG